ncbi:MAG TPA: CBS domain-containing protein [Xanthobacteraceae bacterium]|nr:CBS domain-containing protein [Xanthobacteraceae bacterium]
MTVRAILDLKGRDVVTIAPEKTLADAAELLSRNKIGAVVVVMREKVSGILSERDIVRAIARSGTAALEGRVVDCMTSTVVTCSPHDTMAAVMNRMTAGRFRHLPVIDEGRLAGIVSIGDVVKHRLAEIERESSMLRDYIMTA